MQLKTTEYFCDYWRMMGGMSNEIKYEINWHLVEFERNSGILIVANELENVVRITAPIASAHWGWCKLAAISQMTLSDAFYLNETF